MRRLIYIELYKVFTKPRTYISFGVVFFIVAVMMMAMYAEGETIIGFATEALSGSFSFEGKIINGYLITFMLFNTLLIHVPILVALVTGDQIAGEYADGTIRLMLLRPYSRTKVYLSKIIVGGLYTALLILFLTLSSLIIGVAVFGDGDLIVLRRGISVFDSTDVLWRFGGAFVYGLLSMLVIAALSNMFSCFSKNSIGPIVGTIATIIGVNIITNLGLSALDPFMPYLFNVHFIKWQYWFDYEIDYSALFTAAWVQVLYIVIFYFIGYLKFKKQDVLY